MLVYHLTAPEFAAHIRAEGFRDAEGQYMTRNFYRGVWVSDQPLVDLVTETYICFEISIEEDLLRPHEWIEEGKDYREFLVPAALLNGMHRRELTYKEAFDLSCDLNQDAIEARIRAGRPPGRSPV